MRCSKIFIVLLVMCVSTAFLTSCSGKSSSPYEQIIYYSVESEPVTLDPQIANDDSSRLVIMNIFEGLTRLDENENVVHGVSDDWKADISKMEYTFHIRDGAKWNDGSQLTAQDFVYSFQRLFSASTGSETAEKLFCIKNSEKIKNNKLAMKELGVYAKSADTLKIQLDYLDPQFLQLLSEPCAMPCKKSFFEGTGGQYGLEYDKILSNGAFCVGEYGWEHKNYINLVRNNHYKGESSAIPKGVNIKITDSPENVCNAILKGEVDCYKMETWESEQAKKNKMNLTAFNDTVWGIVFNMENEVFQNRDIRVSMLEALDRKKILKNLPERCQPAEDIVPDTAKVGEIAYREFVGKGMGIKFSENAKSRFEKAVDSLNEHEEEYYWYYDYEEIEFPELNILCSDEREMQGVVNGIINAWNGITGKYGNKTPVSREELAKRVSSGEYDIAIVPLKPVGESPVDMLGFFESTNQCNVWGFADEKYDKMISDILTKGDSSVIDKMVQAEKYLSENGIFYPLYTEDRYYVSAENVTGIIFHPYGADADFSSAEKIGR